ncbi:tetratricopeptide repeat domain protein [Zopfia rhizophila CBS 207.26]|uniref:Tetratricopeptide repeat domain protein n=1 Tax=Zopfia rhizophila CBS 207.26 TaxID=1314779 RepID=A0A6A6EF89_9PEZI|nr:tetratricopeptide repeat domain protein [Zopfia rhizophila CBS 207.26]
MFIYRRVSSWDLIPLVSNFVSTKRTVHLPCFMIEPHVRNPKFTGREVILQELAHTLLPQNRATGSKSSLQQFVLCGLGGVGKTEIAVEFAFANQDKFDAVFFVPADKIPKLDAAFSKISVALSLEDASQPKNHVDIDANWLIIFDNVDEPDDLYDYWPIDGRGSILITSRDPLSKTAHSVDAPSVDLNPFNPDEARKLLQRLTRMNNDGEAALQICDLLGGLPLAISQMAQIIRRQYLSYSTFLDLYNDDTQRKELYKTNTIQRATYRHNLASVWAFESLSPHARSLLEIIGFLDPDCIQERLLMKAAEKLAPFEYPDTLATFYVARAQLVQAANIKLNTDTNDISVHRLVQEAIRSQMTDDRTKEAVHYTTTLLVTCWPPLDVANKHATKRWKECQALFPHVLRLSGVYAKMLQSNNIEPDVRLATVLNDAGWWQHEIGMSHRSKDVNFLFHLALQICCKCPKGGPRTLLIDIYHSLGAIANETNQKQECLKYTQEEHSLRLEAFRANPIRDYRLGSAHCQLGIALLMNGDAPAAINSLKTSIEEFKLAEGFTKAMLSIPYTNLGFAFWVAGELNSASAVLEMGIKDREEMFGKLDTDSFKCGWLHYALGNVRWSQGQLDASFNLHNTCLLQYKGTIGNNHHRTADACHKVAQHYIRLKLFPSASILIDQALKIWNADAEIYKPEIARTTFLKAKMLRTMGDDASDEYYNQASALRYEIIGNVEESGKHLEESDFDSLVTFWSR